MAADFPPLKNPKSSSQQRSRKALALPTLLSDPVSSSKIIKYLDKGKKIFIDNPSFTNHRAFKEIGEKNKDVSLFLCLSNKALYGLDFVEILEHYLGENSFHPVVSEQIITAAQEAFANAFMWSSLDLESCRGIRPIEFHEQIETKIRQPEFSERSMCIYLAQFPSIMELAIFADGHPIEWPEDTKQDNFRGISIIKSLTDRVVFDPDQKAIRLFFIH